MKLGTRVLASIFCMLALGLFLVGCGASDEAKDKGDDKKTNAGDKGQTKAPIDRDDKTQAGDSPKVADAAKEGDAPSKSEGGQPQTSPEAMVEATLKVSAPLEGTAPRPQQVVPALPIIGPRIEDEPNKTETSQPPKGNEAVAVKLTSESSAEADSSDTAASEPGDDRQITGDWPMWGGKMSRNMVNDMKNISLEFDPEEGKNILWTGNLGSQTYGNPVVAGGRVYVGTNNGAGHRPKHPGNEDRGVLLCFDEKTGELLWQLTRLKLESGRVNDWPLQGICSAACVVDDFVYVVTNRCELMCLDAKGFHDGENDGPYKEEVDAEELDADVVWSLDMFEDLDVFPHNLATSSPVVLEDMVYVLTSNGVDEAHLENPAPESPAFLAVNRLTGEVVWENSDPFEDVLHGQWSSPAIGVVNGKAQVYFPGGDGILRALDAQTGDEIWRFDLNPKDTVWELGGRGSRNAVISTPVFYENSVILGVGQDPEHGEGVGHLWRIDATKTGDLSAELGDIGQPGTPNPNSGVIWHYGGEDESGEVTGEEGGEIFRRTMSTVAIAGGLVIAPDLSGRVHCVDVETGERYWEYDLLAELWGSPMIVDGKVLLGDENGDLNVFQLSKEENEPEKILFPSSIYSTPTIANGVMYVSDRSTLYAIKITE